MKNLLTHTSLVLVLASCSLDLLAQSAPPEPSQVLNLSASAHQQVRQDWLRVVLRATVEGSEAMGVQRQLQKTVDEALARLRPHTQPQQLELRSGAFGVSPRYNDKGRVATWQGQADLVIEGRDFARMGQLAGDVPRMALESLQFSLSRGARQQLEAEVQSQAVQNFRHKAQQLAQDFGFAGYAVRQVTVGKVDRPTPAMPVVAMARMVSADATPGPVPLESGLEEVQVTVSGSIQLR